MATVLGTVISVSLETDVKKQAGGSYKGWELVYKSKDGQVQTIAKPVQGLKFNQTLRGQLAELEQGDQFTLEQEKNAAGFNDVKSVIKGWAEGVQAPTAPSNGSAKATPYVARDYEGKEEREARQRLIVRQSSLTAAVNVLSVGAKSVDKEAVKALANEFTDFVFETETKAVKAKAKPLPDDFEDDIPS
jgi:citrate synthase